MSNRLTKLVPDRLTSGQRALYDLIEGGPRRKMGVSLSDEEGGLIGPFNAYLHTPELGGRLEAAGVGLRESTALAPRLREIAILVSAKHHRAQFEWYAHAQIARNEGVEADSIEAIRLGEDPGFTDPTDVAVHRFAVELLEGHRVGDETFAALAERLPEREQVELVFVLGYYALVSMTLNVFEVALPEGESNPFE
jgi:4-carboxymuconolactone decarboxylase